MTIPDPTGPGGLPQPGAPDPGAPQPVDPTPVEPGRPPVPLEPPPTPEPGPVSPDPGQPFPGPGPVTPDPTAPTPSPPEPAAPEPVTPVRRCRSEPDQAMTRAQPRTDDAGPALRAHLPLTTDCITRQAVVLPPERVEVGRVVSGSPRMAISRKRPHAAQITQNVVSAASRHRGMAEHRRLAIRRRLPRRHARPVRPSVQIDRLRATAAPVLRRIAPPAPQVPGVSLDVPTPITRGDELDDGPIRRRHRPEPLASVSSKAMLGILPGSVDVISTIGAQRPGRDPLRRLPWSAAASGREACNDGQHPRAVRRDGSRALLPPRRRVRQDEAAMSRIDHGSGLVVGHSRHGPMGRAMATTVRDVMRAPCPASRAPIPSVAAARRLRAHAVPAVPVCGADGEFLGMLTSADIIDRCVADGRDPRTMQCGSLIEGSPVVGHAGRGVRLPGARARPRPTVPDAAGRRRQRTADRDADRRRHRRAPPRGRSCRREFSRAKTGGSPTIGRSPTTDSFRRRIAIRQQIAVRRQVASRRRVAPRRHIATYRVRLAGRPAVTED